MLNVRAFLVRMVCRGLAYYDALNVSRDEVCSTSERTLHLVLRLSFDSAPTFRTAPAVRRRRRRREEDISRTRRPFRFHRPSAPSRAAIVKLAGVPPGTTSGATLTAAGASPSRPSGYMVSATTALAVYIQTPVAIVINIFVRRFLCRFSSSSTRFLVTRDNSGVLRTSDDC